MNIDDAIAYMKAHPDIKVTMPTHYRSYEYNYYDSVSDKFLTEYGREWNIAISRSCNELHGYEVLE